jgi:hypothetical protein
MPEKRTKRETCGWFCREPECYKAATLFLGQNRRPVAERSPPPAIERRCFGDRRSTAEVAWESHKERHATRETTSGPSSRPPPEADTLALRDRRGASAGVASRSSSGSRRRLRHHAPYGVTTAEPSMPPARRRSSMVPFPCRPVSGVSVPPGTTVRCIGPYNFAKQSMAKDVRGVA